MRTRRERDGAHNDSGERGSEVYSYLERFSTDIIPVAGETLRDMYEHDVGEWTH